nr:small-conductance mechanosensitive channel-like [Nerophis lumbriciformis]
MEGSPRKALRQRRIAPNAHGALVTYEEVLKATRHLIPGDFLQAGLIIGAALLAAMLVRLLLNRLLPRLARRTATDVDDQLLASLHRPLFWSLLLIGVHLASLRLGIDEHPPFDRYLLSAMKSLAILLWMAFGFRLAHLVLAVLSRHHARFPLVQAQTLPVFDNLARVFLFGGAVYFLLLAWNADVSGWLASAGVLGLALGLAAKDTLANLFAGMSLLTDRPFQVGDFIVLEDGMRGEVTEIGIRSSRILTRDDIEVVIPNSILANTRIVNERGGRWAKHRVRIEVGVAYDADIDKVRQVLMEIAEANELVCEDPEPRVRFRRFDDSSLAFELLAWIAEPVLRGRAIDGLNVECGQGRSLAAGRPG